MSFAHPCVCPLACSQDGGAALAWAAGYNRVDAINLLISQKADIHHQDKVTGTRGRRGAGMGTSNSQERLGANVFVGANSCINPGVSVCDDVIIGSGSIVINDISKPGSYVGIPAKRL